jgi:hypothetical protein
MNFDFLKKLGDLGGSAMSKLGSLGGTAMSKLNIGQNNLPVGNNPAALSTSPISSAIQGNYGSGSAITDAIGGNGANAVPAAINNAVGGSGTDKLPTITAADSLSEPQEQMNSGIAESPSPAVQIPQSQFSYQTQPLQFSNFQADYKYAPLQGQNMRDLLNRYRGRF